MNRDDIIQMARDYQVSREYTEYGWQECNRYEFDDDELEHFATLVAAHEREECAKACEQVAANPSSLWEEAGCWVHSSENCIAAIRVRSEK